MKIKRDLKDDIVTLLLLSLGAAFALSSEPYLSSTPTEIRVERTQILDST